MDTKYQRQKGQDGVLSSLNMAIEALNLAKDISGIAPVKAAFGSVSVLLTMVRVRSLALQSDVQSLHKTRIRWLTRRTMSSSGYPALIFVERLIGE